MKKLQRYLSFLLAPLVEGTDGEADNLSLLLQMLDIITSSYQDALDPSSDRIHLTARVARQVCVFSVNGITDAATESIMLPLKE